jgi:hypothetical protein
VLEAPLAVVAEILVPLFVGIAEMALHVLVASARPWGYLLVPSFRRRIQADLSQRSLVARAWYMLWGTAAILASVAVVAAVWWFFQQSAKPSVPAERQHTEQLARKAASVLKTHAPAASTP